MFVRGTTPPVGGTGRSKTDTGDRAAALDPARSPDWPPPGLEDAHGAVWPAITSFAVGAVVLVLPLLAVVASGSGLRDPVPLSRSVWPLALFGLVGGAALADGVRRLVRLFTLAARAAAARHGIVTFAAVATDPAQEAGALLRGEGRYTQIGRYERGWLLRTRTATAAAYLLAALWPPLGFALSVRLAAAGHLDATGVWIGTLAPAAVPLLVGLAARAFDRALVRAAVRTRSARASDGAADDARPVGPAAVAPAAGITPPAGAGSGRGTDRRPVAETLGPGPVAPPAALRAGAVAAAIAGLLALAPLFGIATASMTAPIVGSAFTPEWIVRLMNRMAEVEPLRVHRLAVDSTITVEDAGDAVYSLAFVGRTRALERIPPLQHPPARVHEQPWFPDATDALPVPPSRYPIDLFPLVASRALEPAQVAFLERVASHPAHRDFELAARAPGLDLLGARYVLPLPDTLSVVDMPIPPLNGVRRGVDARLAAAALALERGRFDVAERTVREVISVGFLLVDDAPMPVDAAFGRHLVGVGGAALQSLYEATGRTAQARAIEEDRRAAERVLTVSGASRRVYRDPAAMLELVASVDDQDLPRSIRWELIGWFNTVGPCMDGRRLVFGHGAGFGERLERARDDLVRSPAEAAFFELLRHGHLTALDGRVSGAGWAAAALPLLVGREELAGCGRLIRGFALR